MEIRNLLNEREAATLLNCSVAFMRRCRLLSRGPAFVKIGRNVRYRMQDLEAYIESNTRTQAA